MLVDGGCFLKEIVLCQSVGTDILKMFLESFSCLRHLIAMSFCVPRFDRTLSILTLILPR